MSNSVVFLLIAVGLSVLGTTAVWLHGRPRRNRHDNADFGATLRALSATHKPPTSRPSAQPADPEAPGLARRDPRPSREARPGT